MTPKPTLGLTLSYSHEEFPTQSFVYLTVGRGHLLRDPATSSSHQRAIQLKDPSNRPLASAPNDLPTPPGIWSQTPAPAGISKADLLGSPVRFMGF